jgi:hypothetical protein
MTDEQKVAFINAQTACALAEIAGMQAENSHRAANGNSVAYGDEAFFAIPDKYGIGHNTVVALFQG